MTNIIDILCNFRTICDNFIGRETKLLLLLSPPPQPPPRNSNIYSIIINLNKCCSQTILQYFFGFVQQTHLINYQPFFNFTAYHHRCVERKMSKFPNRPNHNHTWNSLGYIEFHNLLLEISSSDSRDILIE